ncbi:MAG: radical SAM protein [Actinomycetota bacterium]
MDRIFRERVPYSGSLELTHRCNLTCRHCYQFQPAGRNELDGGQWQKVMEDLAAAGCLYLNFTGGEPLLREDLPQLIRAAAAMGYVITLQTNAVLIDEAMARMLGGLPTVRVDVSVYGARPETHDRLTGMEGSFAATRRALGLLHDNGVPLLLKVTVGDFNLAEVEDIAGMADDMGLQAVFSSIIFPRNDRDPAPLSMRLDDAGLERFVRFHTRYMLDKLGESMGPEVKRAAREDLTAFIRKCAIDPAQVESEYRHYCGGGTTAFAINPFGDVYPCIAFPLVVGNVLEKDFSEIWENSPQLQRLRGKEEGLPEDCKGCDLLEKCAICMALSYLEEGEAMALSGERCRQTRMLVKVLTHDE